MNVVVPEMRLMADPPLCGAFITSAPTEEMFDQPVGGVNQRAR
jgi:hypothetical protein